MNHKKMNRKSCLWNNNNLLFLYILWFHRIIFISHLSNWPHRCSLSCCVILFFGMGFSSSFPFLEMLSFLWLCSILCLIPMASASILDLPPGLKEKVFSKSRCKYYYLFLQTLEKCPFEQNLKKKRPSENNVICTSHIMKPSDPLLLANVTLHCGMYPAGKTDIFQHLAIPGFPKSDHTVRKLSADAGSLCREA